MNKCAILHIPLSQFAYAQDEHTICLRLRAEKNDLKQCCVFYGDRVAYENPIPVKKVEMKKVAEDELFDYYEAIIRDKYTRVCYYFTVDDGINRFFYYERGFDTEITDNRTEFFQFPYIRREDIIRMPTWAENAVMYHIFPDSFADGHRHLSEEKKEVMLEEEIVSRVVRGGTLKGIEQNVDYIAGLGINCLYLNPIFTASSYHKYDTINYFSVDPCLGTNEDLKELVMACHEKGIRVILDGVFNHCGAGFAAFRDVLKRGKQSQYYDWFYDLPENVEMKDPPEYEAFAYVKEMPKLNTGNPEVVDYFVSVGKFWIEEADIDGWRLDVANEINHDFWRKFKKAVRSVKPDIFLIGEIWENAQCWLMGDQFDSTMNYPFSYLCRDFFAENKLNVSEFDAQLHGMLMRYPAPVNRVQMNFLDSHDIPRFLSYCIGEQKKLELAMFFMLMMVGIPSVFYGDELYISGQTEKAYRSAMPWQNVESGFYSKLKSWIALRKENDAIRYGDFVTRYVDDENNVYFFERTDKKQRILIGINNGSKSVEVSCRRMGYEMVTDLLSGEEFRDIITLNAMEGKVLK